MSQTAGLAPVIPLRLDRTTAADALAALDRHLGRCKLADNTVTAYRRQAAAYVDWLAGRAHPDAFADDIGAEGAVTAWRRELLAGGAKPSSVNQALAAVTLMYELCRIRIKVKRARVGRPGAPEALNRTEEATLRREAQRRGARDFAIVSLMLGCGARIEEVARLAVDDIAFSERSGSVRLFGKGDEVREVPVDKPGRDAVRAWLLEHPGGRPLWTGRRGPLTRSGLIQAVRACAGAAGLAGFHPHQLRHTFATRQREEGADLSVIQELLGHRSIETTARYTRPSAAALQELVDRRWAGDS
jgi:site-specific recombinase XerD